MNNSSSNWAMRLLLASLLLLVVVFTLLVRVTFNAPTPGEELPLDRLYRLADSGNVLSATLLDEDSVVVGELCLSGPTGSPAARRCRGEVDRFHTTYPGSDVSTQQLIERLGADAIVKVDPQPTKAVAKLLMTFLLPLLILANLFGLIFMSRSGDSSMTEIIGFGRMGKKKQREQASGTGVTFADVAGQELAVDELREVIDYLKEPGRFESFGAVAPKGVLLFGPPGCGKTLLARAAAGESGVPFISVSGTEFVESLVGVGAARVRDLFANVRARAPAIVFIDEIDAVGRRREGEGVSGGEREQTLNQLLVEMDGFDVASGVVLMAATNRPDILDSALLRPGRFDRQITLEPPDVEGRKAILQVHAAKRNLAGDVELASLARRTPGFTGADLASVMNEAVLLAIRDRSPDGQIKASHLSEAVQRVLHGPHRGKLMTPVERERIATHEAGHALVAAAVGRASAVLRVSIVARGRGLGQASVDGGDRVLFTPEELEAELAVAMGGIAAETLRYGRASTTSEDDVARATSLAREMIGLYGMSGEIGRVRLLNRYGGFLGGNESSVDSAVSEETLHTFHLEVKALINGAEEWAKKVLVARKGDLESMADLLQEEETLEGPELEDFLERAEEAVAGNGRGRQSAVKAATGAGRRPRRAGVVS